MNLKSINADSRVSGKVIFVLTAFLMFSVNFSVAVAQIVAFLFFFLWLFEKNKKDLFNVICKAFTIMLIIRLISVLFSEYPELSRENIYKEALLYISVISFSFYFGKFGTEHIFIFIRIFLFGSMITSVIAFILLITTNQDRASGIVSSLNTILLAAYLFSLGFYQEYGSVKARIFWILQTVIIFTCLVLTLTKTHIAIALIFTPVFLIKNKIKWYYFAGLLTIAIFFISFSFKNNPYILEKRINDPFGLAERDIIWESGFRLINEHPFLGFGPKTFVKVFPSFDKVNDKDIGGWHNDFLEVYLESGVFAFGILVFIFFYIFYKGFRILRSATVKKERDLHFTLLFILLAMLLVSLTWGLIFPVMLQILFAIIIALFFSNMRRTELNYSELR